MVAAEQRPFDVVGQTGQDLIVVRGSEAVEVAVHEIADGVAPAPRHWRTLQPWVTKAVSEAELVTDDDTRQLGWSASERLEVLLHPVAYAAFQLLTGPDLRRVKRCADCPWLFLDQSRNHSRRWCTMDICGRDHKKALYVARRAERRRAGAPREN